MSTQVELFTGSFGQWEQLDATARDQLAADARTLATNDALQTVEITHLERWLAALTAHDACQLEQQHPQLLAAVLQLIWRGCESIAAGCRNEADCPWPEQPDLVPRIMSLYQHLGRTSSLRHSILKCLAEIGNEESLEQFAELIVLDPPTDDQQALLVFTPLFQRSNPTAGVLFPRLLDGLSHVQVATPILDLANHLTRQKAVTRHPAAEHVQTLANLLTQVTQRLEKLTEQNPLTTTAESPEQLKIAAEQVAAGSALVVALCDAVGLIGNHDVVGSLYNALELRHRRIRTEAAAALARLGQDTGVEALRELAREPATRVRAIAYLEELAQIDRVEAEFRTPQANAEGELTVWLADPTQFGVPPNGLELLDERSQYWPGFEEPQTCFLFRYTYQLKDRALNGVGFAGPTVHAISCDLEDLPPADIYALYAGWHAEHDEITEQVFSKLAEQEQQTVATRLAEATRAEYQAAVPVKVGLFLGELHVVATAIKANQAGVLILDAADLHWFPQSPSDRPMGPDELYWLFKGRKILKTFNPG